MVAYAVVICIFMIWQKSRKFQLTNIQSKGITALLIMVGIQFLLGVFTLLLQVPVWLGVLHQVGAFVLLSSMIFTLHRFSK
jgi:cytochrome c oxidase assembly protein subunit 15